MHPPPSCTADRGRLSRQCRSPSPGRRRASRRSRAPSATQPSVRHAAPSRDACASGVAHLMVLDGEIPGSVAAEGRQVADDAELAVARHDLLLQRPLRLHERARQRPPNPVACQRRDPVVSHWAVKFRRGFARTVRVLAPAPSEESRAVRPVPDLHVGEAELGRGQHLVLHLLLPGGSDNTVVARQRHPCRNDNRAQQRGRGRGAGEAGAAAAQSMNFCQASQSCQTSV